MLAALAPIIGAVAGAAVSGGMSRSNAKAAAEQQAEMNRETMQNRYQWTKQDLLKAGYNPILAVNNGQPPAPSASAVQAQAPDIGGAITSGIQAGTARSLAKAQESNVHQQTAKAKAETDESYVRMANTAADAAIKQREINAIDRDPDAYWRSKFQSPVSRSAQDIFDLAGSSAKSLIQGGRGLIDDVSAARAAHRAAEERQKEVDRRYPRR